MSAFSIATPSKPSGFTIVELLIVIVVIGILAAITIVAFNGVQDRAKIAATQAAATQATKKILAATFDNADNYPVAAGTSGIDNLAVIGITNNGDTTYQYSSNNTVNPRTFCLTATKGNKSSFVSNTVTGPTTGACPGHSNGLIATITSATLNPGFETDTTSWTGAGSPVGTISRITSQFHSGNAALQVVTDGTVAKQGAFTSSRAPISPNIAYTGSMWVKGDVGKVIAIELGEVTSGGTLLGRTTPAGVTMTGSWQRITATRTMGATAGQADIVIRNSNAVAHTFYIDDAMITEGSSAYNYADGNTNNWVWNGTANNSTSTGIPI